ncbi:hypothetical protein [Paenirhodobacter sp. CAU 1674]|uniref:hypothetical protein n=1 Tax=Paenirhodobacter sp. CAU 1674 TaxID=3032596 RepID=UPI0023D9F26C|nr:hypothetical protein [Paenirhodobacter sp. CAU 1674]MDF2141258.1 hypothetical protein [Paenirhodobacter sp. CAU 1674]
MTDGASTTQLPAVALADEIIVNAGGASSRQAVTDLGTQLLGSTAIGLAINAVDLALSVAQAAYNATTDDVVTRLDTVEARQDTLDLQQTTNNVIASNWTELADTTPTIIGQGAEIPDEATGTHADPATALIVPDAGRYRGYDTVAGAWTRVAGTGLSSKLSSDVLGLTARALAYASAPVGEVLINRKDPQTALIGAAGSTMYVHTPAVPKSFGVVYVYVVIDLAGTAIASLARNRMQIYTTAPSFVTKALTLAGHTPDGYAVFSAEWDISTYTAQWIDYELQVSAGAVSNVVIREVVMTSGAPPLMAVVRGISRGDLMARYKTLASVTDTGNLTAIYQLVLPLSASPARLSARMDIDTDGTLPETVGAVELKTSGGASIFKPTLRRVGKTNSYVLDDVPIYATTAAQLYVNIGLPSGASYMRITNLIVTDGGIPVIASGGVSTAEIEAIAEATATDVATDKINALGSIDSYPKDGLSALRRGSNGIVDLVMLSNSHGQFGGAGLAKALSARLAERFGAWVTPLNLGTGPTGAATSGFSADLGTFAIDMVQPGFVAAGSTLAGSTTNGVYFSPVDNLPRLPLDPTHSLRVHYGYAVFGTGSGSFTISMRHEESPWNMIFTSAPISTYDAAGESVKIGAYDLAADAYRNGGLYAARFNYLGNTITGPFMSLFIRVEDIDATHGICTNVAFAAGGYSMYDIATSVLAKDDNREINFFAELRRLHIARGMPPNIVIFCNEGHNQRAETSQPSLGRRAITDADGPLALLDNYEAVQRHYDALWISQGWDVRELTYVMWVDHPPEGGDDAEMTAYRRIMTTAGACLPRTSVVDSGLLATAEELTSTGSYADGIHLVNTVGAGYDLLAQRFVAAMVD